MRHSCNVFFYQAGLKIGGAAITKYATAFGLGQPTGIDLGAEKFGLIPQPKSRGRRGVPSFQAGDIVNMSIGQGQVLVTPMQVARFMAAVANGGVLWKPRLVQRIERPERGVVWSDPGSVTGHVELNPAVWAFLRQSLWAVVNTEGTLGARVPGSTSPGRHRPGARQLPSGQGTGPRLVRVLRAGEGSGGRRDRARGARGQGRSDRSADRAQDSQRHLLREGRGRRDPRMRSA